MIPPFNHSHVLPPFLGDTMSMDDASPYVATPLELVQRLGYSPARRDLLRRFFALRARLRQMHLVSGFMWLDGSFVEETELQRHAAPNDIDIVFFAQPAPKMQAAHWLALQAEFADVFVRKDCKAQYGCDFFLVNLAKSPEKLVRETRYWYGLFSHRRGDQVWKGMLELQFDPAATDAEALALLDNLANPPLGASHASPA